MKKLGVDAGNANINIVGEEGYLEFPSDIGEFRERNLEDSFSKDDMIFQYKERIGFAGTLAKYESEFSGSIMGDTKATDDLLIRVLLGIHRLSEDTEFKIIVGQPIKRNKGPEKNKIKELLKGEHEFTLNGVTKLINILEVNVAPEGAVAFHSDMKNGVNRYVDLGGGTCNLATIRDGKMIDRESDTLSFGANSTKTTDLYAMCRAITIESKKLKWDVDDKIWTLGGKAKALIEPLQEYFPTVDIIRPKYSTGGKIEILPPSFGTAVGLFQVAKAVYKDV